MAGNHRLTLEDRSKLTVLDINDVINFDENIITLSLGDTELTISGSELSIQKLMLEGDGEVIITGKIEAVIYSDNTQKKGRMSRLFNR